MVTKGALKTAGSIDRSRATIGISEPTLYRYFDSKRELYLEAIELGSGEILARWHELAKESPTPVEALLKLGVWYFEDLQRDASTLMLRARAEIETDDPADMGSAFQPDESGRAVVRAAVRLHDPRVACGTENDARARSSFARRLGAVRRRAEDHRGASRHESDSHSDLPLVSGS